MTSARRSRRSPLSVISSRSPGPEPTRTTLPGDTEPLPQPHLRVGGASGRGQASQLIVQGLPPALGVEGNAALAERAPDIGPDIRQRRHVVLCHRWSLWYSASRIASRELLRDETHREYLYPDLQWLGLSAGVSRQRPVPDLF